MTRTISFCIPDSKAGCTIKEYAKNVLGFSTRVLAEQKRLPDGILRNGTPCFVTARLQAGDTLSFSLEEKGEKYDPAPLPFPVLWETEDYIAIDKPFQMPIHPSPGHNRDSLLNAAAYYFQSKNQSFVFRPLYRLDKDTSGIVLLGKHRLAVSAAQLQKCYFAVCQGYLEGEGNIDFPIGLEAGSKIKREVGHGDCALTYWKALKQEDNHTLVALSLATGRTHQIRVHMASIGHPLVGDDLYGGNLQYMNRQALHCGLLHVKSIPFDIDRWIFSDFPADIIAAFPWIDNDIQFYQDQIGREFF